MKKRVAAIVAGVLVVLLVAVVAATPWAYKNYVQGPPEPELAFAAAAQPGGGALDGTWAVQPGSQVGYRVQQQLLWETVDVAGRGDTVTGSAQIEDSHVRSLKFTVDVAGLETGSSGRDEKFRSADALETDTFPTAELVGNVPTDVSAIPADGSSTRVEVPVQLTIKGVTRPETAQVDVRRNADRVEAVGTVPVRLPDFNVTPPKPFASLLEVQPAAVIEFLVYLAKA